MQVYLLVIVPLDFQERRKAINAERSARLAEMQLKRKRRQEEIELKNIERDKVRPSSQIGRASCRERV